MAELNEEQLKEAQRAMIAMAEADGAKVDPEDLEIEDDSFQTREQALEETDEHLQEEEEVVDEHQEEDTYDDEYMAYDEHVKHAKADGWTDKETFEADPKNRGKEWIDAPEFNRRKPLLEKIQQNNRHNKTLQQKLDRMEERMKQLEGRSKGDQQLDDDGGQDDGVAQEEQQEIQLDPAQEQWMKDNPWFVRNEEMRERAVQLDAELVKKYPAWTDDEIREEITNRIKREFPAKFARPRGGGRTNTGQGGGRRPADSTPDKSYSDMPAEAKAECDRFVRQGILTRDQFVKDYFS